jgi:hypothetical protein
MTPRPHKGELVVVRAPLGYRLGFVGVAGLFTYVGFDSSSEGLTRGALNNAFQLFLAAVFCLVVAFRPRIEVSRDWVYARGLIRSISAPRESILRAEPEYSGFLIVTRDERRVVVPLVGEQANYNLLLGRKSRSARRLEDLIRYGPARAPEPENPVKREHRGKHKSG